MDNGSEKHPVRDSANESMRPGFLGGGGGGEKPGEGTIELSRENAAEKLGGAEETASGGFYRPEDGAGGAKATEERADGLYSGGGKDNETRTDKAKGIFKKGGPILGIFLVIFGVGGLMVGTQAFQPFSLVEQFREVYNSMHTSANVRSEKFFAAQMSKRTVKSPYNIFGTDFKLSEKQRQKLSEQGIEYKEDYEVDGQKRKALVYTDADGKTKAVTADNFKSVYQTDTDFFQKYNAGSMTWRGAVANWFGTNTSNFLKNNKLTRNMWEKWKEASEGVKTSGDADTGSKSKAESEAQKKIVQDTIDEHVKGEGELRFRTATDEDEVDADGNSTGRNISEETPVSRGVSSTADVKAKVDEISSKYASASSLVCGVFNAFGAINLLVTANQALQVIQITTSLFEAVDKTKAGLGDEAPIMVFSNALNERVKTTNITMEDGEKSVAVVRDRTAMESEGIGAIFSRTTANPNDPSVTSFNMTSNMRKILGGIGVSMASFSACSYAKIAGGVISGAFGVAEVVACVASFGVTCAIEGIAKVASNAALAAGIGAVVSLIVPTMANAMMRDLVKEFGGENWGNAITLGANMYLGSTHRANGGSLATEKKYEQFAVEQAQVMAENAKYERESLSPFDITSKHTFMGSIMTQLMNYNHANSIMSALSTSSSVMSSSLASLTGTASAVTITNDLPDMEEYEKTCPYLASIGAVGDSFCQPYVVTDMGTIEKDPAEVLNKVQGYGGFSSTEGENVTIDSSSDLAKYIKYCDNRQSAFGIADQNIVGEVAGTGDVNLGNSTASAAANGVIGALPVIGDAIDIIQGNEELAYAGYISGESCVAGNDLEASSSPEWSKAKYYQRFIEDQSLAESMGVIDKSAVTAFLEEEEKKNPVDNSYEGRLARYSGLEKEDVIALLDIIEYENYIANYDPSDRYVFGEQKEGEADLNFESENLLDGAVALLGRVVYYDVRNRNFVV